MQAKTPTHGEVVASLKREIKMRERVYPRRVAECKMQEGQADHEINCMIEALRIVELNGPQQSLFNPATEN